MNLQGEWFQNGSFALEPTQDVPGIHSDRTVTWISSNPSISSWWQLLRRTAVNYATQFCCKLCNAVLKRRVVDEQIAREIYRLGPPRDILTIFFSNLYHFLGSNFFVLPQTRFSKIGSSPNLEKMSWPWVDSPFQLGARADFQKSSFGWSKKIGAHQISLSFRKNCQNVSRWSQSAYLACNLLFGETLQGFAKNLITNGQIRSKCWTP